MLHSTPLFGTSIVSIMHGFNLSLIIPFTSTSSTSFFTSFCYGISLYIYLFGKLSWYQIHPMNHVTHKWKLIKIQIFTMTWRVTLTFTNASKIPYFQERENIQYIFPCLHTCATAQWNGMISLYSCLPFRNFKLCYTWFYFVA